MNARPPASAGSAPPSTFVTVVAWIFIVFSGMATLISAMQNLLLHSGAFSRGDGPALGLEAPVFLLFGGFFVASAITLTAAIGLLRRRAWARRLFIAMLVVFVAAQIGGLVLQQTGLAAFDDAGAPDDFMRTVALIRIFAIIFAAALCSGFVWIIRRLVDPEVRAEFR